MDAGRAADFVVVFLAAVFGFAVPFLDAAVDEAATEGLDFAVEAFLVVAAVPVFLVAVDFALDVVDFALVVADFALLATDLDLVAALVVFGAAEVLSF